MRDTIRSEFLKLRTTRTGLGLIVGMLALTGLALWGGLASASPAELAAGMTTPYGYAGVLVIVALFVLVLAIRSYTDEARHGSVVPTFLATPNRLRVLAGKATVAAVAAAVFAVFALAVGTGVMVFYLSAHGYPVSLAVGTLAGLFGRAILITVLWSVIGISVGVIVRHQVAAIVGTLAWLFVAENIVGSLVPSVAHWLPGSAAGTASGISNPDPLMTPLVGMLILAGWAALAIGAAAAVIKRRDVL